MRRSRWRLRQRFRTVTSTKALDEAVAATDYRGARRRRFRDRVERGMLLVHG
ncbi:MAG: hypothetical protein WBM40_04335 [Thiohalocapsa sp.]